jgi:hypothetical protein
MDFEDLPVIIDVAAKSCTILNYLPKPFCEIKRLITKIGFEFKTDKKENFDFINNLENRKKSNEEIRRCKEILKKYNLPKSVGIRCKSEKSVYFTPYKTIVDKTMNNLHLKSSDGYATLSIGGGSFVLNIYHHDYGSSIMHQKIMNGTVIKHKTEIYLLRHPLGGYPYYLARLELFINGMILEFNDDSKIGLYYSDTTNTPAAEHPNQ